MVTRVVMRVVKRSGYGNVLHYGLSMFVRLKKLSYPSVIPILIRLSMLPDITKDFVKI